MLPSFAHYRVLRTLGTARLRTDAINQPDERESTRPWGHDPPLVGGFLLGRDPTAVGGGRGS